ncbi:MAG: hypothetical protein ACR2N5_07580, partial [Solirubrobacterales bacterium]
MIAKRGISALFLVLVVGLAACGGDDDDSGGGDTEIAAPGSAAGVCSGEAVASAPEYTEGSAEVAVFTDAGEGYEFTSYSGELPDGSESLIPEEASAIVCMEVTESEVVETCEFTDDDSGESFTEELADATYNVTVLVAQTGDELVSDVLSAEAGDCGIITSFEPGEGSRVEYAKPGEELTQLLAPYT